MDEQIDIQAQILTEETCQFTVDRPVYPEGSVYFASKDAAKGSPLAEILFNIENIAWLLTIIDDIAFYREQI